MRDILSDKKTFFIIIVLMIILALIGVTYSYLQSEDVSVTFRGNSCFEILYTKGQEINGEIIPGATYDTGHSTDVTMYAKPSCDVKILGKLYITTNKTSSMDLSDGALKYAVSVDGEIVSEGTVDGTTNQLIYEDFTLNKSATIYKVYIWLDIALEDMGNVAEEIYSGFIHAEAIAESTIAPEKGIATDLVLSLATVDACAQGGEGLCPTNSYTAEDGTVKYHDYRYRGPEPNNYVWFNNDMYRIIGVFDENTHGVEGEYLIKLIMADPLMGASWGVHNNSNSSETYRDYKNDWTGNTTGVKANLNVILNEFFYNKNNTSSIYGSCKNWTYFLDNNDFKIKNCSDIVGYGINNMLKRYIQEATWHLNGYEGEEHSKQDFYLCERGLSTDTTNCKSANSGTYSASTIEPIGLMYVSDYMYASSYFADSDTTTGASLYYGNNNWLRKGNEWSITPVSNSDKFAFTFDSYSRLAYYDDTYYANIIRPTFYLGPNIYINSGTGSYDDPFKLSI